MEAPSPDSHPGPRPGPSGESPSGHDPHGELERRRLALLAEFELLDTADTKAFDALAGAAAAICGTPMAAVSLIDAERQWFAGETGLGVRETEREVSFCAHAIREPDRPMVVPDTFQDVRFAANRLVTGDPRLRSYAGIPLVSPDGVAMGSLCVLDRRPRTFSEEELTRLRALADAAVGLLEARRAAGRLRTAADELDAAHRDRRVAQHNFDAVFDKAPTGMSITDDEGTYLQVNDAFAAALGRRAADLVGHSFMEVTPADSILDDVEAVEALFARGHGVAVREKVYRHADGSLVPAVVTTSLVRPTLDAPPLLLSTVESLAEQRTAESQLLEAQSAVDAIISIDSDSRITSWNLGAERMLGHRRTQVLGRSLELILPERLWPAHRAGIARLEGGAEPRLLGGTVRVPARHRDGHELLTELSLSRWERNGRTYYTGILRDVTERHAAEQRAGLVRHAATIANEAMTLAEAAPAVIAEVCGMTGWLAGHAWIAELPAGSWYVAEHEHPDRSDTPRPGGCALAALAGRRSRVAAEQLPVDSTTRVVMDPDELAGSPLADVIASCGLGGAVAVPVLAGDQAAGVLALYLPAGAPPPAPALVATLEQLGVLLGRVVERERTARDLVHRAAHDPLTGLANRTALLERVAEAIDAARSTRGDTVALYLLDLDRFKLVNDSLGHTAGDLLLKEVAARLSTACGNRVHVARLGGDEFVVLVDDLPDAESAAQVGQRLHAAVEGDAEVRGQRVHLRASIGAVVHDPRHDDGPEGLLRDADVALRHAKQRGKGRVEVFDAAMRVDVVRRLQLESALDAALPSGELFLHYQPIVSLETGRPVAAEALLRWQRPGHGLVPPDQFIPIAEDNGAVIEIGRWALRQACSDAAAWRHTVPALAAATVSVNVSSRQLGHPAFVDDVRAALSESGLDATQLTLEITESLLLEDDDAMLEVLHALRALGVRLALDDFGTGYSSMSYVQRLPVDILKIDKRFVDPITGPGGGTALVEVVLKLAAAVGLTVVAEGVETPMQVRVLRRLGCGLGQGYAFARPASLRELAATLQHPWPVPVRAEAASPLPA